MMSRTRKPYKGVILNASLNSSGKVVGNVVIDDTIYDYTTSKVLYIIPNGCVYIIETENSLYAISKNDGKAIIFDKAEYDRIVEIDINRYLY